MSVTTERRRVRFSIKTLLIVAAIVAAPLGYTQWRRQSIYREARELEAEGFYLLWDEPNGQPNWQKRWLPAWLWPVVPKHAAAKYDVLRDQPTNRFRFGTAVYTDAESLARWEKISDRLRAMGVKQIRCDVDGRIGDSGVSTE